MAEKHERRHVFISYRRKEPDTSFTNKLASDLQAAGHPIWMDVKGIEGAEDWGEQIQRAIDSSYAFVLVLSPDSVASRWVRNEMTYALGKMPGRVYPVLYRDVELPLELVRVQHVDFTADYLDAFNRLMRDLPEPPRIGPHLPEPLVAALDSELGTLRLAGVAELIRIGRGDVPDLASLAREELERLSRDDPDERVRGAAGSLFEEEKLIEQAEAQRMLHAEEQERLEAARRQQQEAEQALQRAREERRRLLEDARRKSELAQQEQAAADEDARGLQVLAKPKNVMRVLIPTAAVTVVAVAAVVLGTSGILNRGSVPAPETIPAQTEPASESALAQTDVPVDEPTDAPTPTESAPTVTATPHPGQIFADAYLDAVADRLPDYEDDFEDPSSGWEQGTVQTEFERGDRGYAGGYYHVVVPPVETEMCASGRSPDMRHFDDMVLEVSVRPVSSSAGARFGLDFRDSGGSLYQISVGMTQGGSTLSRTLAGDYSVLDADISLPGTLAFRDWAQLRIVAVSSQIFVSFNNEVTYFIDDPDYTGWSGNVWMKTCSSSEVRSAEVQWDNLRIWDVSSS